jgi:hypothetical protein
MYANGSSTPTYDNTLSGTISHGSVVVYKNSSAALTLPDGVTASSNSSVAFNGDDALTLYKISTSSNVDVFGKIGHDPGSAWTSDGVTTEDKTLVRKASVTSGVTTSPATFDPSTEWTQFDVNTATNLGSHTMDLEVAITALDQATAFANYVMTGKGLNASGTCGDVLTALNTEYDYMIAGAKTEFGTNDDTLFVNARARMAYLETWVASHGGSPVAHNVESVDRNNAIAMIAFSAIGLTSLLGFQLYKHYRRQV